MTDSLFQVCRDPIGGVPCGVCGVGGPCDYERRSGLDRGWQMVRLGRFQGWMFRRGWTRLPNAVSTFRWWLWLHTGGSYD